MFFSDEEIAQLIAEDVPFLDLTTYGLNIGKELGEIEFSTRHTMTICATEEAARVFEKCGAKVEYLLESGTCLTAQQLILKASGCAEALHIGWRVALNLMEYASGIATRAKELVDAAKNVNSEGGINLENVRNYASTGVDILVTSYPYFGKPADIGAKMKRR
ncbi:hypothetical protein FHK94_02430 [Cylindrospermopsis raciborskii CS-506_D]|uniref:Quinolinate phosphoribosyl transferase N-terminal domain-containing protein n=2 Tax=Cylindrospermopsis raciborskii TaxID=77022 RepID=A0A838WGH7_9CYAN|nr:hypothetical protein [Cylindrospermopsis raciborskii CS-506_C]MBA4448794.1 hypothetical protein [Cylindrospermopsis raciborskii CS-506_D]MBA4455427.1 hypothetical protein [Cylindrospermopsis raciborskii CS-506_B]MBA4464776.1 hypothetical protein [Cylindrospermopsis raciborskii CS-506_A]OHY35340.1 hypothetical protein BCV63_01860 [Cylindrospermopsis raciborskii CS-508]